MTDPNEPGAAETSNDPRNREVEPGGVMPAEFVDTPHNRPGDQSPPTPADVDDT